MELQFLGELLSVPDLERRLAAVEERLTHSLGVDGPTLAPASRRVASAGGKRLRPALTIAAAAHRDVFDDAVVTAAVAVELVQVGSLVHDDIFEDAPTRRGVPTINSVEGNRHALLAGDFILARAASEAATVSAEVAADVAATIVALCAGQMAEMRHVHDVDRPTAAYFSSIGGKTAELFACSLRVGARCAGLPDEETQRLGDYGYDFGLAYQVLDDVLDLIADPARLGKPVGMDVATGVYTLPVLLELAQRSGGDLRRLLQRRSPDDLALALRLLQSSDRLEDALAEARRFAARAATHLEPLRGPVATALAAFPTTYVEWALDYFTASAHGQDVG